MINLKRHSKVVSIVLAMVMVFATAAVSFAAETEQTEPVTKNYNVKIYKKGTQTPSMANAIIAPGTFATATTNQDGSVKVEIPIIPIYNYTAMGMFTADGYLTSITMKDDENQSGNISPVANSGIPYTSAVMTIKAKSMPTDLKFEVSKSIVKLFKPGTDKPYWLMKHVKPSFDIVLTEM